MRTRETASGRGGLRWWLPILILVVLNLGLGLVVADDYGISWDDPAGASIGEAAMRSFGPDPVNWEEASIRKHYGPAYLLAQNLIGRHLTAWIPDYEPHDARRLVSLMAFQVAIVAIYLLGSKLVGYPAALAGTILFATQPLLIGHAFINAKDIPFMAFFLLSIALGYRASERLSFDKPAGWMSKEPKEQALKRIARSEFQSLPRSSRYLIAGGLVALVLLALDLYVFQSVIRLLVLQMVEHAYHGTALPPLNWVFERLAEDRHVAPVEAYLDRGLILIARARLPILILLAGAAGITSARFMPLTARTAWSALRADLRALVRHPLEGWTGRSHISLLLLAATAAGLTVSIRVAGLFVIFLIALLYLGKHGLRSLAPLLIFGAAAAIVSYLTWPYLWSNPVRNLIESIRFYLSDPNRDYVLFMGEASKGRLLPWFYLPTLMLLQFTEPLWILVGAFLVLLALRRLQRKPSLLLGTIFTLWLTIPTVPMIVRNAWFYDNFRQFLFVTPIFFLLAMYAIHYLFVKIYRSSYRAAIVALFIVPGLISLVRLHPYQYVYYNALVGGVRGAEREYELDYWATSYAEAMRVLNPMLPRGSVVAFWGTTFAAEPFARPDLQLHAFGVENDLQELSADFAVIITRANIDRDILPSVDPIAEVTVNSALLAVAKPVPPDN